MDQNDDDATKKSQNVSFRIYIAEKYEKDQSEE